MLILSLVTLLQTLSFSQDTESFDPVTDDISGKLPPLEVLIDSAFNHTPEISIREQQVLIAESKLKSKKIEWTRNIGMQASAGYGNMYNYSTSSNGSIDPLPVTSTRYQNQFNASLYLNLPVSTIADRRNQLRLSRAEISQEELSIEQTRLEIRQLIILKYNNLIMTQKLFRIKIRNFESIKIKMELTETEFRNGVISLTEYTNVATNLADAESNLEMSRTEFLNAYMILEELVGFRFNLFNSPR